MDNVGYRHFGVPVNGAKDSLCFLDDVSRAAFATIAAGSYQHSSC